MPYYTRVLSKNDDFPTLDELHEVLRAEHAAYRLTEEDGGEDGWVSLLLSTEDEVEVAVLERSIVTDGSPGQDEVADMLEDLHDARPESGADWVKEYLGTVRTVYAFQHLAGSELVGGGDALHALRSALFQRGDSILQADLEGFTNEEGYHVVWQFADTVTGPWNMAVLQDGTWYHFAMDLGDPDHRAAFLRGDVPADLSAVQSQTSRE
jgi:hypothetical protein